MPFFESLSDFWGPFGTPLGAQRGEKEGAIWGLLEVLLQEGCFGALWGAILDHFGSILGGFFTIFLGTLGEELGTGNPKERQRNTEEKTKK